MSYKRNLLRELAKSTYWQCLYIRSKEIASIQLFQNQSDLSQLQMNFMQWLEIYSSLFTDFYCKKPFINEDVINDEIRTDAYLLWKSRNPNYDLNEENKKTKTIDNTSKIPSIIFKGKK